MSKIGYVRVSTLEQHTERQEVIMERLGVEKVFIEKASGKDTNRPQLRAMLEYVREGDELIIESFSRLSRSVKDLIEIVDQLGRKGVILISQKEQIDTTTPVGRMLFHVTASIAQFEREITLERQREGIEIAKAEGKYKGRPPRTDIDMNAFREQVEAARRDEAMVSQICKRFGIHRSTYYRLSKDI